MDEYPADDKNPYALNEPPSATPPPPPPPPPSGSGPVETHVRCIRCGHNLTGATIGGNCPECGEPIDPSVQNAGKKTSGYAIACLVLGIVSIPLTCCYGIGALITGGLAIVFNRLAARDIDAGFADASSSGINTAGLICGIIGLSLGAIYFLFMLVMIGLSVLGSL